MRDLYPRVNIGPEGLRRIEEFFIRPQYRGQGHGKALAQLVRHAAQRLELPLRMWVNPPDAAAAKSPATVSILKQLRLCLESTLNACPSF